MRTIRSILSLIRGSVFNASAILVSAPTGTMVTFRGESSSVRMIRSTARCGGPGITSWLVTASNCAWRRTRTGSNKGSSAPIPMGMSRRPKIQSSFHASRARISAASITVVIAFTSSSGDCSASARASASSTSSPISVSKMMGTVWPASMPANNKHRMVTRSMRLNPRTRFHPFGPRILNYSFGKVRAWAGPPRYAGGLDEGFPRKLPAV